MEFILEIKYRAYVINVNKYVDAGTHQIALYCRDIETTYFDSIGSERASKEIEKLIGHKNIKTSIFRIQANISIMCDTSALDSVILCARESFN